MKPPRDSRPAEAPEFYDPPEEENDMKTYAVTIPIAGHLHIEVEANSEEEAIEKGMDEADLSHIEEWTALQRFNQGNVCYCPSPWEAEAECVDEGDASVGA